MSKGRSGSRETEGDDLQSRAAEMIRRALTVGIGAIFLTEESLRGLLSEFKLPKELLQGLLESASKTRKEFLDRFSQDVLEKVWERMGDRVDGKALAQETARVLMQEALQNYEVHVTVRFSKRT